MMFKLSALQQDLLFNWMIPFVSAEVGLGIEPSGYRLIIDVVPGIEVSAKAEMGVQSLHLGDIELVV